MTQPAPADRSSEAGFSLVMLFAGITIMMIMMAVAMPSWKYVVQNEREQELFFRGNQIAAAIERFQKKNGNAAPTSLDMLVKGKFLRKEYVDPMTKDGKWRFIRPGEGMRIAGTGPAGTGPGAGRRPAGGVGRRSDGPVLGPFVGVASLSEENSLRVMNGAETYDQWMFVAGKPRVLGKPTGPVPQPGGMPGQAASPAAGPAPQKK